MGTTYEEIMQAALSLPAGSRAMLAEHLLQSLDAENQIEFDGMWAEEVDRRAKEVDEKKFEPIPGETVLRNLRAKIG